MTEQTPLTPSQMTSALQQVFKLLGELKIDGNQAQLLISVRSAVAEVNNSLVVFFDEAAKLATQTKDCCKVNGEAKCGKQLEAEAVSA